MALQRADLWKLAHREKGLCCWWHRQVSGTDWSLGRLLPTFVMHKGNARIYQEQGKPEGTVHAQWAKHNSFCKNRNISQKTSDQDCRNIAGEKCKGKRSTQKWHYFLSMLNLWCSCYQTGWYRERLVYFPLACFPSQPFFCSRVSQFSLLLLFLMRQRRGEAFKKL